MKKRFLFLAVLIFSLAGCRQPIAPTNSVLESTIEPGPTLDDAQPQVAPSSSVSGSTVEPGSTVDDAQYQVTPSSSVSEGAVGKLM